MHTAPAEVRKQQRELAEAVYNARMGDLVRSKHKLPAQRTIGFNAYADWYETHVLPTHRGHEREREILTTLRAFFGNADLLSVTTDRVKEYRTSRLATVKPRTVNREVGLLKQVMQAAVPKYFDASPLRGMANLRIVKPQKRVLEPDEEKRLLQQLSPTDRAFYLVAVDSLMRLSNVINLRRDEDRGDHFTLTDSKTGPYTALISSRVRRALDALPKTDPEYFFPHRRIAETSRDQRGAIRNMLKRACARCEPPIPFGRAAAGITFHTGTRATGATRMLRAGFDLRTVQAIGNWKDFRSMADYLHGNTAEMRKAVEAITPAEPQPITPRLRGKKKKKKKTKKAKKSTRRRR